MHRMSDHKPPAIFISGSLGLDFLNTLATPVEEPVDWIENGTACSHGWNRRGSCRRTSWRR